MGSIHSIHRFRDIRLSAALAAAFGTGLLLAPGATGTARAQTTRTWTGATSNAWRTTSNWSGGVIPGDNDLAVFQNNTQPSVGINMNQAPSNVQQVGAIQFTSGVTAARTINNSSGTVAGTLQLNGFNDSGTTILLSNASAGNMTLANGTSRSMNVVLATTANIRITGAGNITISSLLQGTGGFTKIGSGTGELRLSNAGNIYSGNTTISAGTVRIDAVGALSANSPTVTVNESGRLTLNVAGTHGAVNQTLALNANQTATAALDTISTGSVTYQGGVRIDAASRIDANTALTLSGNISGTGTLIKQGTATLTLSGTGSTATGGTQIRNGKITVNSGSSLGTGVLDFSIASTTSGAFVDVELNNTAQTIGGLASSFAAVNGSQTQRLTLNTTALTINQASDTVFGIGAVGTLRSVITGTGSITLGASSTGILTITSESNDYTGGTTISGGTLNVMNAAPFANSSATGQGAVNVSGGTLAGTGFINGATTLSAGGVLNPGDARSGAVSAGTLTFSGALTLAGGTIGSSVAGFSLGGDLLSIGGEFNASTSLVVTDFHFIGGTDGTQYTLATFGTRGGNLSASSFNSVGRSGTFAFDGSSLVFTPSSVGAVPEPGSLALAVFGAASSGAALLRRRRRTGV